MLHRTLKPLLVALAACSSGAPTTPECTSGSDCASGVCNGDGTCASNGGSGGSAGAGGAAGSATTGGSAGSSAGTSGGSDTGGSGGASSGGAGGGSMSCAPNMDGILTRGETPLAAGLKATFRIAQNVAFASAGTKDASGVTWDFSGMLSGDHDVLLETTPLDGAWFASQFPGATYSSRLSESQDLLGVFEVNDSALLLRGIVSPQSGPTQTELTYTPPVTILQFPMSVGASWSTQSTVAGTAEGVPATYFEVYQTKVDLAGTAITPFSTFPVLRVGTVLTQTIGTLVTVRRTYSFAAECFGVIAKIQSKDDEPNAEFSTVSEVERLAP